MIDLSWAIEDDGAADPTEAPRPLLSTWNYLRGALRRRWPMTVGLALLGALLGLGFVLLVPPGSTAAVTLLMVHPANMDGPDRGAMDLSLLSTREVADRTVRSLGLALTPEAFRATVTAEPLTPEVLTIKVSAPDDASAVARGRELVRQYLAFRATQLTSLSSGLRSQYMARITSAQEQVTALTRQFEQLSTQGGQGASQAFDVLAQRSDLNRKIANWQETIDNATLQTQAALQSTHVIDPVHADRASVRRELALAGASGLVVGACLGVGIVLFRALVTERLRLRKDVGIALGASVRFSVRSKGPRDRRSRLVRWLPARAVGRGSGWRGNDLAALAYGLESALRSPTGTAGLAVPALHPVSTAAAPAGSPTIGASSRGRRPGPALALAVAAIGNPLAAADVLLATAALLRGHGANVFVVDLSRRGVVAGRPGSRDLEVHEPTVMPGLARGPRGAGTAATVDLPGDSWTGAWNVADVVLALVEVDPGIDVGHITTWADQVVPLVKAGAATAELLSTTGDLVREAGLGLPFAMMVACDATDESLGIVAPVDADPPAAGSAE